MRTMYLAQHADAANQVSRRIGILRYGLVITLLMLSFALCAETFTAQGFEAGTTDTWNYTANPPDMSRVALWGRTDQPFGGATAQAGTWYWLSWDLNNVESSLTFDTVNLPIGYVYTLSFYYFTNGLNPATEFNKYSVGYDNGSVWGDWTNLSPDTDAWTLVSIPIPAYATNVRLKLSTSHDGTGKYAHWDSFRITRDPPPLSAPVVYNTSVTQRTDGSGIVDIYYDLMDANGDNSTISLLLSDNAGTSFSITPNPANLSGDVGAGILPASGKHIVWSAGAELVDFDSNQYKLRIVAEDNTQLPQLATPTFTPLGGDYAIAQNVSINCSTPEATIRYTTNGNEPTESSAVYSIPLTISNNTTLKAKAFKVQWSPSETATAVYTVTPIGFANVPSGTFTMGDTRNGGVSNELPAHSVTLSSLYMGKYEVTQGEYQAVMGSNPATGYGVGANYPVYNVSWYSVLKYCNLRSINEGLTPVYTISGSTNPASWGTVPAARSAAWDAVICNWSANGYRLPTEAEWEYAARGATNTPDYLYSGSEVINAVAWYTGNNSPNGSKAVGTKAPNSLGIYDMSGNEWEWCWDWYGAYNSSPSINPTGAGSGITRLFRSGDWSNNASSCRVSTRSSGTPYSIYLGGGFRICRSGL